ncbi:MAG: T9SS type A sorting domain-containing protein [Bacteroidales bacterium]|nr:T9SS type A sorting domain-containing protein [Bacteroidales bacterium]
MKTNPKHFIFFLMFAFFLLGYNSNLQAQVWNREAVDSTGISNGAFCSLEIDNNNGAHIAYMDADFYDLKYAIKSGGEWMVSVIDSLRYTGISSDLAIDSENHPHICFQEGCEFVAPCPDAGLKYMTKTAGGWIKETVDEFFVFTGYMDQTMCSIQLNSHDQPVIAYFKVGEDAVKLAYKDDTGWNIKDYQLTNPPVFLSLCIKSDDTPVIQYVLDDSLHVTTYDMDTEEWEHYGTSVVPRVGVFQGGYNFDIDNEDKLHFVFPSFENGLPDYKYIYFDWQEWTKEILPKGGPFYIKVDNNNIPSIIDLMDSNGLSVCKKEGAQWTCELIDEDFTLAAGYASFASLDFDSDNNAQIAVYGSIPELSDEKTASLMYYSFHPGLPDIEISTTSYDFGEVWTQSYIDGYILVKNTGIAPLVIANLQFEAPTPFEVINMPETVFIQVGDSLKINVRFTPTLEQAYSEVLKLITNDQNYPIIDITFMGTGVSSGTTASLNVQVNDVFVDMDYLIINEETPLAGADVVLYKNSQVIEGPSSANNEGQVSFDNLSPGFYEVKISKMLLLNQEETLLASSEIIEIGPGANTHLMVLPDSLYQYKYQLLDELNEIKEADYLLTGEYFTYENVESKVDTRFKEWATNYDPVRTESLARLILVETMVKDLFDEGLYVSNEMFADFGNLIGFLFYYDDWGVSFIDLIKATIKLFFEGGAASAARDLFELLLDRLKKELIKQAILESITESVQLIGAELPHFADIIINEAWKQVKREYSSWPNLSFGSVEWDEINSWVRKILKDPFIQAVYIETQTSPAIKDALDYSIINDYNGTFTKAFRHEIDYVSKEKNDVEEMIRGAAGLRIAANLFMLTANILEIAGAIDPTGMLDFAEEFSSYLRISAYVEVVAALGISTSEFFRLPSDMKDAVDDIYFPEPKLKNAIFNEISVYKKSKYGLFNEQNIKEALFAEENSYDSVLFVIKDKIVSGDRQDAVLELNKLLDIDHRYSTQIKQAYAPVSAVAREANESISGFIPMYDSLISYKALADQEKMITFLKVFCVAFDSTGQITDTVLAQIDRTIQVNHTLTSHISEMLDLVSANMELPGVIVASMLTQEKLSLDMGEDGSVLLKIKNVGAVKTDNIRLKIETNDALTYSGPDSILVGSLDPGEESDEIEITLNLASKNFKLGIWDILIECDNAVAFSPSGSFSITETSTGISESASIKEPGFYCYPNPVSSTGIIFYELNKRANLKIELYDLSGRKLKTLLNNFQEAGDSYLPWSASSLANGMYIIKLQVDDKNIGSIRVVINK